MSGSAKAPGVPRWKRLSFLSRGGCRYFAVDGGAGAQLLAELARVDPALEPVASPRHADLLLVVEPITQQLAPAVAEVARALPRPARVLVIPGQSIDPTLFDGTVPAEELLPGALRARTRSAEAVAAKMMRREVWPPLQAHAESTWKPDLVPSDVEKELATESVVLSLGPIQPFTAGPLRTV